MTIVSSILLLRTGDIFKTPEPPQVHDCNAAIQGHTIETALGLLTDSLSDITLTLSILLDGEAASADNRLIRLVSQADTRAEDVCGLARRLLQLLRAQATATHQQPQGALHRSAVAESALLLEQAVEA